MRRLVLVIVLVMVALAAAWPQAPRRRLARARLEERIRGGWAGQTIGVS